MPELYAGVQIAAINFPVQYIGTQRSTSPLCWYPSPIAIPFSGSGFRIPR